MYGEPRIASTPRGRQQNTPKSQYSRAEIREAAARVAAFSPSGFSLLVPVVVGTGDARPRCCGCWLGEWSPRFSSVLHPVLLSGMVGQVR